MAQLLLNELHRDDGAFEDLRSPAPSAAARGHSLVAAIGKPAFVRAARLMPGRRDRHRRRRQPDSSAGRRPTAARPADVSPARTRAAAGRREPIHASAPGGVGLMTVACLAAAVAVVARLPPESASARSPPDSGAGGRSEAGSPLTGAAYLRPVPIPESRSWKDADAHLFRHGCSRHRRGPAAARSVPQWRSTGASRIVRSDTEAMGDRQLASASSSERAAESARWWSASRAGGKAAMATIDDGLWRLHLPTSPPCSKTALARSAGEVIVCDLSRSSRIRRTRPAAGTSDGPAPPRIASQRPFRRVRRRRRLPAKEYSTPARAGSK